MRQRAAASATPPRSADSDQSWQNQARHRGSYQSARREEPVPYGTVIGGGSTSGVGAESGQDSHAPRRRRHHSHNQQQHGNNPAPLHNSTNTKNHHYQTTKEEQRQQQQQQQLLHSPQHYLSEYNKNYGIDLSANAIASAGAVTRTSSHGKNDQPTSLMSTGPRSAGSVNTSSYLLRTHSQRDVGVYDPNATASDVYYAQYANHSPQHQHHHHHPYSQYHNQASSSYGDSTNRPANLRRHNSAGNARTTNAHKASFQHFEATFHLDPNPIAAVHFRKALHVPDKQYREYIHGCGRPTTAILNPICCANVCAGFSFVGFLFLFFIGILLDTQPLYIGGTLPSATKENDAGKTSTIYFMVNERLPMATNAYQTSYVYLATALICLIYVYYERLDMLMKQRRSGYQDVPDHYDHDGNISDVVGVIDGDDGSGGGGGPDGGGGGDSATHAAYQMSNRNRLSTVFSSGAIRMREWAGSAAARIWNGRQRGGTHHRGKPRSKACAKTV